MLGRLARNRQTAGPMSGLFDSNWLAAGLVIALGWIGTAHSAPNILLIIGDDMGVETVASYGVGENPPMTTHLDDLASNGVRFTNFWAQPVCSPTRATIITGRYGFRTGIGRPVTNRGPLPEPPQIPDWALPYVNTETGGGMGMGADELQSLPRHGLGVDEYTLTHAFDANGDLGYSTAAIGKWHLADADNGWQEHPIRIGFDYFSGGLTGGVESYFAWNKVVDGEVTGAVGYAMRDEQYKLMRFDGVEEFYDLKADPYEHHDLLEGELSAEQRAAYAALKVEVETLRSSR